MNDSSVCVRNVSSNAKKFRILSKLTYSRWIPDPWASAEGEKQTFAPVEIGTKNHKFLESLKSAA